MALPTNADVVVVQGYWWDEITQQGVANASVSFKPVPLGSAVSATKTPNLRDLGASGYVKTRARVAPVDPDTGYFATLMVASNDPDLDAYGGREVIFASGSVSEPPFVVEVPYNASTTTVDSKMAGATGLDQGATVRVVWLADAALLTTPTPAPSVNYLTSTQTLSAVADGIEAHEEDGGAHPEMQAALLAGVSEQARDALGAALTAGANITITPNDGADTITIAATVPAEYTDEQAQDTIAAVIAAGTHSGISFSYNDASATLSATVTAQSWSQITGKPTFAAVATSGSASDITTGTLADAQIASTIARDSEVTTGLAGKANTSHTHGITDLTATGTASSTTYLRGDNTWATPAGGGAVSSVNGQTGAVTGLARVVEGPLSFLDPRVGGVLDGATDNGPSGTDALNDAATLLGATGGELFIPPGIAHFTSQPASLPSNLRLRGAGKNATLLRKAVSGAGLLRFNGTSTSSRCQRGGVRDLQLVGDGSATGALLTGVYADHLNFTDVWFNEHPGIAVEFTEVWDTYFHGCEFEHVSGTDGTKPAVLLKSTAGDSTNNIWFDQCRWESFKDGALWIATGGLTGAYVLAAGASPIYGVYLTQCKMETHFTRGPFIAYSNDVQDVHVDMLELAAVGLDSGATAPDLIDFIPLGFCTLSGVRAFINGNSARSVFRLYPGAVGHRIEDVNVDAVTALGVGVMEFAGGTPAMKVRNIHYKTGQSGTVYAGSVPSSVTLEDTDPYLTSARTITAGTGLTGGGALTADRTLAVSYGTTAGTATQGNDSRVTGAAQKASNLSDLASASTARTNLGLAAVAASGSASDITTGTLPDGVIPSAVARDSEVTTGLAGKQDVDSDLTAIAGLTHADDTILQTKSGAWSARTPAQVKTDLAITASDVGAQSADSDLTAIAGLTATTDNFLQAKSSAWASRTPAQVAADLQGTSSTTLAAGNDARFTTVTANTQTSSYTLVLADAGKAVEMNNASANTLTIPPNSTVAFPVGTVIEVFQLGAGQTTVTAGAGVTLRAPDGAKTSKQYASGSLRKRATDEWVLAGSTTT